MSVRQILLAATTVSIVAFAMTPASAQTVRYANQGELKSLDPYTLNESTTHGHLGNVYEGLIARDKDLNIIPALADPGRDVRLFSGVFVVVVVSLVIQGWTAICMGDLATALSAADEAERLAAETSEPVWSAGAQAVKAVVAAISGKFDLSAALAASAQRLLVPTGTNFLVAIAQIARGLAALGSGRHGEAYEQFRRIFDPADPAYHPVMRCWFIGDLVEAATRSGEAKAAQAFLEEVTRSSEGTSSSWTRIQIRYANALLSGDENADTIFQAVMGDDLARFPFLRGRVLLSYGTWLRRQRRIAESRAPLRTARDAFDGISAIPWAEQARQQLRATGESSSLPLTRARDNLSPQELQIATMAAEGLSNREIGQKLYLSHRTIGAHLYRLYPKLEITSRGQLAKALSGQ